MTEHDTVSLANAYRLGWKAYQNNWSAADNPFPAFSKQAHAWAAGANDRKMCFLSIRLPDPAKLGFPEDLP
jgi:hypothetical protein